MTFWGRAVHNELTVLRWGVSAACAQQSNETFPAISATELTASQAGSPLGSLVRMLSHNCTTCWQRGHKEKGQERVHLSILLLNCIFFWHLMWMVKHVTIKISSIMSWKVIPFNPLKRQTKFWPFIPSNNRFLLFLLCHHSHKIVKLSWDKWLITIKPVRLLHSPSCVKTPRAQNRSEDWQLPLPQDTSLLLVLICANAYACGGVSILYRRGLGTLVRINQSALIECKEQVSGAVAVHSMLHVYYAVCVHLCTDIMFDMAYSIGAFVLMLSFEYRSSV